jgi:hypothetical protein
MRKKLAFLIVALAALAGSGVLTPPAAQAWNCVQFCEIIEDSRCCSTCCGSGFETICTPGGCVPLDGPPGGG